MLEIFLRILLSEGYRKNTWCIVKEATRAERLPTKFFTVPGVFLWGWLRCRKTLGQGGILSFSPHSQGLTRGPERRMGMVVGWWTSPDRQVPSRLAIRGVLLPFQVAKSVAAPSFLRFTPSTFSPKQAAT